MDGEGAAEREEIGPEIDACHVNSPVILPAHPFDEAR